MIDVNDCKLRLMQESDLEMVLTWRNSDRVRANMYSDHIISLKEHQFWFEKIKNRQDTIYLIFEYKNQPIGLTSYTDIDEKNGTCFSGMYIGENGILIGAGTIMSFLCTTYIFEVKNIRKISVEVFDFNKRALSYQKKLGYVQEGYFFKHILKNGVYEDVVRLAMFKENWLNNKPKLKKLIFGD